MRTMTRSRRSLAALVAGACAAFLISHRLAAQTPAPQGPARFEAQVAAYEATDRTTKPPAGAILLVGDSQFFRWKTLGEDLPGYTVINRGIDSFQLSDLNHFFDRLVLPYKPRMIVLHVGGNDLTLGKTPEQILSDFTTFVANVRKTMPATPIAFSSITPSPGRWQQAAARRTSNRLVRDFVATDKSLLFIDLWDAMLTPDGQPREDIWVEDRIHPNQEGYRIRVRIMTPLLGPPDRR
jgi:lysophospholipase L1-like esterase